MIREKRIENLKFEKLSYLKDEPKHPSYGLSVYQPNQHYGKLDEHIEVEKDYFVPKDNPNVHWKLHRSCFQSPEVSYIISKWIWNNKEMCYEYRWVGDRPMDYYEKYGDIYKELVKYGFEELNSEWYD